MAARRYPNTSLPLDRATVANLKSLAARRHNGDVAALLAEIGAREVKFAAAEAFFEKYGIPPVTDAASASIEAEWRGETGKKKRPHAA